MMAFIPPQLKNKEFVTIAKDYLSAEVERRRQEASGDDFNVSTALAEVTPNDFFGFIMRTKGEQFTYGNMRIWSKDARKALKHADRCIMSSIRGNNSSKASLPPEPDLENLMNRSLFPRANSPDGSAKNEGNAVNQNDGMEPRAKKRRRVRTVSRSQAACSVPTSRLSSVPFIDRSAISRLLSMAIASKLRFVACEENPSDCDQGATGCLVLGPRGCGKTNLVHAVAGELDLPLISVCAATFCSAGNSAANMMTSRFEKAVEAAPSVLLFTQVEALPVHYSGKASAGPNLMDTFVEGLRRCANRVLVLGETSCSQAQLNDSVKQLFPKNVTLGAMDLSARRAALSHLIATNQFQDRISPELTEYLARRTPGFEVGDLYRLLEEINLSAPLHLYQSLFFDEEGQSRSDHVSLDDLLSSYRAADLSSTEVVEKALMSVVPLARQKPGFVSVPDVTWADVGAMDEAKAELERFLTIVRDPELADALCRDSESLLLFGPPGCGKTMLAKAVSNEAGLNFISVKGPELFDKYQGESERHVREVFERARACPPCLIFFDELDALCGRRGGDSNDGRSSVVLQLLTEMDGLTPRGRVFVMGATNRLDIIDEAFLRRGRMGRVVRVGPPATVPERTAVLRALCRDGTRPRVEGDVELILKEVASDPRVATFTGAELRGVLDEAKFAAQKAGRDHLIEADFCGGLDEVCREREAKATPKRGKR